ncbi:MAG TPA: sigma-70 family RNA polymerase sigma factor [Solirubrobacteraceae bacterium]|nr:sigma-70 family RNA polymerase sigma factor [Solirubrobacteraceae bacterium]
MDAELAHPIPARAVPLPLRLLGDERLARLVGSGIEEAFTILYQRHHQALYRYCRSLVGTDTDAHDALQSAMTGALVALRAGRRDAPIRPWLFRIAYNESITQLRRRRPAAELVEELPALEGLPEDALEQRTRIARLLADLRELPERQRGALVMKELSGLSHQEVAEALGLSIGSAKQTVFEARRSLQEFDEGRAMACEDIRRMISDGDGRSLRGRRVRAHLRDCTGCSAFAGAIPQREADLRAVAPALPVVAAAGLLMRITGAGSGSGSGGSAGLIGGATGKAVVAGASGKLVATGALIVVTAAVGTGGIIHAVSQRASSGLHRATLSAPPAATRASADGAAGVHHVAGAAGSVSKPGNAARNASRTAAIRGRSRRLASPAGSHDRGSARHGSYRATRTHTHAHGANGASALHSGGAAGGRKVGSQKNSSGVSGSAPARSGSPNGPATGGASRGTTHTDTGSGTASGGSATTAKGGGGKTVTRHTSKASSSVTTAAGTATDKIKASA